MSEWMEGGRGGEGKFRNLIKRNQLQQQTDSDKAKPFVLGTDLDSWWGRGRGECDATQLNSSSTVQKRVYVCA